MTLEVTVSTGMGMVRHGPVGACMRVCEKRYGVQKVPTPFLSDAMLLVYREHLGILEILALYLYGRNVML